MSPSKVAALARLALLGLVGFGLAVAVAGAVIPGYSPVGEYISALAARTNGHPWIMTMGFVCSAVATVAAAVALGSVVFPLDCSTAVNSCAALEVAGQLSDQHVLHNLVSLLSRVLLAVAYIMLSRALRRSSRLAHLAMPTLVVGLGLLAFVVGLVIPDFGPVAGIVQLVVVVAFGWSVRLAMVPASQFQRLLDVDALAGAR